MSSVVNLLGLSNENSRELSTFIKLKECLILSTFSFWNYCFDVTKNRYSPAKFCVGKQLLLKVKCNGADLIIYFDMFLPILEGAY